MAHREGVEGMQSYSAWDESFDRVHMAQSVAAWCFENFKSPDAVTEAYAKARFGPQADKALRALRLQDKMLDTEPRADESGLPSNYTILMHVLCYYFYSYVRAGKPYPRSFPGEAVQTLLNDREAYERVLRDLNAMAAEAEGLWREIALDCSSDVRMARRYAWEAAHVKVLTADYLAILQICALCSGTVPASAAKEAAGIAEERRLARLGLMEELERTKEDFLAPSHLRNHSIYMQFFADLEGYLSDTDPSEIRIDPGDFSPFASEAFRRLR